MTKEERPRFIMMLNKLATIFHREEFTEFTYVAFVDALGIYDIEDLAEACRMMVRERSQQWYPTPAEIAMVVDRVKINNLANRKQLPEPEPTKDDLRRGYLSKQYALSLIKYKDDGSFIVDEWTKKGMEVFITKNWNKGAFNVLPHRNNKRINPRRRS